LLYFLIECQIFLIIKDNPIPDTTHKAGANNNVNLIITHEK